MMSSFNFLKYKMHAAIFSVVFLIAGIAGYIYNDGFRYSVDFTGGTQVFFKFNAPIGSEELKAALSKNGWHDAVIREFSSTEVVVRVQDFENDANGLAQRIRDSIQVTIPHSSIDILEANGVGPGTGQELRWNFILMLVLCFSLMFAYIAMRFFSFSYGIGAIVALLHDPLAILAIVAIFKLEISPNVISSIIAAVAYSINDTIVIFARIRARLKTARAGESVENIVNESLNQTLSRTMLMSLATFSVVAALFFFGGESLRAFSLPFMIGIFFGTYSSIFIASPIMLFFRRS